MNAPVNPNLPITQRDHALIRGTILYESRKPDRMGHERGREFFVISKHGDGKRSILAHCEIDDRPSVMRDIHYSVDDKYMPLDCFVRLTVGDRFMGSGWFRFGARHAECEAFTSLEGRVSQRMDLDHRLITFQNHAIACDAWHMAHYDVAKGGVQSIDTILLSSPDHRGATGPMLFKVGMHLRYAGRETITVRAGTFDALHFQFVGSPGLPQEHPPYDIWCTADGDFLFLKGEVGGYMKTYYELTELHR